MQDQSLPVASGGVQLDEKRRESVRAAVAASRADNTRTQYRSGWGLWCRWAEENGHQSLPAEPLAVAGYLAERAGRGARVATVQSARASISAAHRFAGLPDPTKHELVQAAMKGLARQHARPQRQAKGLTVADVAACLAVACVPRKLPGAGWKRRPLPKGAAGWMGGLCPCCFRRACGAARRPPCVGGRSRKRPKGCGFAS